MVWHEPLDDKATRLQWDEYLRRNATSIEYFEIDAAETCSVEEFSKRFEIWVTSKSSKRVKLLGVLHAHFLSLACQQTLRRWLETKSYRCRVWFHMELLNNAQSAIMSRCILRFVQPAAHTISDAVVVNGESSRDCRDLWLTCKSENEWKEKASAFK